MSVLTELVEKDLGTEDGPLIYHFPESVKDGIVRYLCGKTKPVSEVRDTRFDSEAFERCIVCLDIAGRRGLI